MRGSQANELRSEVPIAAAAIAVGGCGWAKDRNSTDDRAKRVWVVTDDVGGMVGVIDRNVGNKVSAGVGASVGGAAAEALKLIEKPVCEEQEER